MWHGSLDGVKPKIMCGCTQPPCVDQSSPSSFLPQKQTQTTRSPLLCAPSAGPQPGAEHLSPVVLLLLDVRHIFLSYSSSEKHTGSWISIVHFSPNSRSKNTQQEHLFLVWLDNKHIPFLVVTSNIEMGKNVLKAQEIAVGWRAGLFNKSTQCWHPLVTLRGSACNISSIRCWFSVDTSCKALLTLWVNMNKKS